MRDVDDPRFVALLREFPDFPIDVIHHLYTLDCAIDEMKYRVKEIGWEKDEIAKKRAKILEKAVKEIEKITPLEK